jgi:hypothetical protein
MFWTNLLSPSSGSSLKMKMEVAGLYKTLVMIYQPTWHDIPENGNPEKKLHTCIKWDSEISDGK